MGEDSFHEVFGLGAGDEDGGSDIEKETVELLLAGDVLHGFMLRPAGDLRSIDGVLFGDEFAVWISKEGGSGNLECVEEQEFGVAGGGRAQVLVVSELCSRGGEGFSESHGSK
jgi:hypothetical protein